MDSYLDHHSAQLPMRKAFLYRESSAQSGWCRVIWSEALAADLRRTGFDLTEVKFYGQIPVVAVHDTLKDHMGTQGDELARLRDEVTLLNEVLARRQSIQSDSTLRTLLAEVRAWAGQVANEVLYSSEPDKDNLTAASESFGEGTPDLFVRIDAALSATSEGSVEGKPEGLDQGSALAVPYELVERLTLPVEDTETYQMVHLDALEDLRALLPQTAPEPLLTVEHNGLADAIDEALGAYRLQHTTLEDGSGYPLVDALTPPGKTSIELGIQEKLLLSDSLYNALLPLFAPTDARELERLRNRNQYYIECRYKLQLEVKELQQQLQGGPKVTDA